MLLIAEAWNGREAIERFREFRPDVTLMDVRLPDIGGCFISPTGFAPICWLSGSDSSRVG
jgi:DNA-binding response OmpR family regulator